MKDFVEEIGRVAKRCRRCGYDAEALHEMLVNQMPRFGPSEVRFTEGVCQLCLDHENEVAELRAALTAVEDWAIADFNEELLGFLKTFKSVPVLETKKETP